MVGFRLICIAKLKKQEKAFGPETPDPEVVPTPAPPTPLTSQQWWNQQGELPFDPQ
jgi:hypothetical protein